MGWDAPVHGRHEPPANRVGEVEAVVVVEGDDHSRGDRDVDWRRVGLEGLEELGVHRLSSD